MAQEQQTDCNVSARQLCYFEKFHIRELVPTTQLGILAEFEFLLNDWQERNGFRRTTIAAAATGIPAMKREIVHASTMTRFVSTESRGTNTELLDLPDYGHASTSASLVSEEMTSTEMSPGKYDEDDSRFSFINSPLIDGDAEVLYQYPLATIIPTVLAKCKEKYRANHGLLTEIERRLLSSAIIDYFMGRKVHLKAHMIDHLADQIAHHFPTESKRAWYDRKNCKGRGRLYVKLYNSHRSKDKMSAASKKRKTEAMAAESAMREQEVLAMDAEAQQTQEWLKSNKCENMDQVMHLWTSTLDFRRMQLRRLTQGSEEQLAEFLESWPSYKWPEGHFLVNLDFNNMFPKSKAIYRRRWPIYMTKIVTLMKAELKDGPSVELFKQLNNSDDTLTEDSRDCTLINLLHAITKPSRCFTTPTGVRRFCIAESQRSVIRLIEHVTDMDAYNETYPCIYAVGPSLVTILECYVVFRDIRYKLRFSDALAVTLQIYVIFKVDYPLPTLNFWQFIRGYFFDIQLKSESSYAVMDNIVQFLDTYDEDATTGIWPPDPIYSHYYMQQLCTRTWPHVPTEARSSFRCYYF